MATRVQPEVLEPYEGDFALWLSQQAAAVREGRWADVDRENVAEELEALGRSEFKAFVSALARIMQHLLKWRHQPAFRSRSWHNSIQAHREHALDQLRENPSFRSRIDVAMYQAYSQARVEAMRETGFDFPEECPFTWDEVITSPIED